MIPMEVQSAGALRMPAIVLAAGLLVAPMLAMIKSPRAIFRTEYILTLGPIYWLLLDLIQGTFPLYGVSQNAVQESFALIGAFVCAAWIGIWIKPFRMPRTVYRIASMELSHRAVFRLILLLFLLAMMKFAIPSRFDIGLMISSLGEPRWATPWTRGALGGWDSILDHMVYFGYVAPCLCVLLASKIGWFNWRILLSGICLLILAVFLAQEGGRRIIGVVFGSAFLYWILLKPRLNAAAFLKFLGLIVLLLALLQFMLAYRQAGFGALLRGDDRIDMPENIRVDDNFYRLAQSTMIFPERVSHVGTKPVAFALIRPVPRALWPGKPTTPGYDLARLVGERGVSLTSSVIGELYACWGFVAVVLGGLFYGALSRIPTRLLAGPIHPERLLVYAFSALVIFAGLRSMIELVLMSYGLIAWMGCLALVVKRRP